MLTTYGPFAVSVPFQAGAGSWRRCPGARSMKTSAVLPLPFMNLNSSKPTTIFTVLEFAAGLAAKQGQQNSLATFDKRLFSKAMDVVSQVEAASSPLKKLFIRLGGFHLHMSFLGSIGTIMAGSGLEAVFRKRCRIFQL